MIDPELLKKDEVKAVQQLWLEFFNLLKELNIGTNLVIFSHNLGAFDGYFILENLFNFCNDKDLKYENVDSIIDDQNKFIIINFKYKQMNNLNLSEEELSAKKLKEEDRCEVTKYKWTFKDSYRLFPVSLNSLCKTFDTQGKTSEYKTEWNNFNLFDSPELLDKFKEYALNDSLSLLKALNNARIIFLDKYGVDITKAVSSPSLALLIFRRTFQEIVIPILKRNEDKLVRGSYYGGSADYYIHEGYNVFYYDVNSLYPPLFSPREGGYVKFYAIKIYQNCWW